MPTPNSNAEWRSFLIEWCKQLDKNIPDDGYFPEEIDVVIGAGGLRGFWTVPIIYYLQHGKRYKIKRLAGASVGAVAAAGIIMGADMPDHISYYQTLKKDMKGGSSIIDSIRARMNDIFPPNAHELCNDVLFVSSHEMCASFSTMSQMDHHVTSTFKSREDLIECIAASMCIPHITHNKHYVDRDGKRFVDGVVPILPIDKKQLRGAERRTLFINTPEIQYPFLYKFKPIDPDLSSFVMRGVVCWEHFIEVEREWEIKGIVPPRTSEGIVKWVEHDNFVKGNQADSSFVYIALYSLHQMGNICQGLRDAYDVWRPT